MRLFSLFLALSVLFASHGPSGAANTTQHSAGIAAVGAISTDIAHDARLQSLQTAPSGGCGEPFGHARAACEICADGCAIVAAPLDPSLVQRITYIRRTPLTVKNQLQARDHGPPKFVA